MGGLTIRPQQKQHTIMETTFWKITIKEVDNDHILETEYLGNVDRNFLIDFYGLDKPDVEWYKIEECEHKVMCF